MLMVGRTTAQRRREALLAFSQSQEAAEVVNLQWGLGGKNNSGLSENLSGNMGHD